jgi:multiple sugar transport system ATP-binding protein
MRKGHLQQVAPPQELYDRPVNVFVAGFIGSPAMNLLEATLERAAGGGIVAVVGERRLAVPPALQSALPALTEYVGREVILGIRPEQLEDAALAPGSPPEQRLPARALLREALGSEIVVHASVAGRRAEIDQVAELAADFGTAVLAESGSEVTMVGRFGPTSSVTPGDSFELVVDTSSLHFFDKANGRGIYDAPTNGAN